MTGAQLMIALDTTVVNVALPHIQTALRFSSTSLSWVTNGYTLTAGGLLLLGGRAGDVLGRRLTFMVGIAIFTLSSLLGGLATSPGMLIAARAAQGVGGALATPAVLALVVSRFPEGRERTRALAIYMGVIMGGASVGLVLGGVINEWLSWRWVLFINLPIGVAVMLLAPRFVNETPRRSGRFDVAGAITSTAGVSALVYAFIRASSNGWADRLTIGGFVAAAVLLAAFIRIETQASQPITPLRLFADAGRSGAQAARMLLLAGTFSMFYFQTLFNQQILGFSPLRAGLAFLPMTVALFAMSRLTPRIMPRFGGKPMMIVGLILVVAGMAWLSRVSATSGYWASLFGPMLLVGIGTGQASVPLTSTSLAGVPPKEAGAASAMLSVLQMLGGSIGLAVLVAVFGAEGGNAASAAGMRTAAGRAAFAHGIGSAFLIDAIFGAASLLVILLVTRIRPAPAAAPERDAAPRASQRGGR
jgi:EmrB/QacA subfamily drug resistance transporter